MFTLSTTLIAAFIAADAGSAGETAPGRAPSFKPLCAELDCSKEQRGEIHEIDVELHDAMRLHHLRMVALKHSLRAEMREGVPDRDDISRLRGEVENAREEAATIVRDARRDMLAVLTPEQRSELRGVKAERKVEKDRDAKGKKDRDAKVEKDRDAKGKKDRARSGDKGKRHPGHQRDFTADVPMRVRS